MGAAKTRTSTGSTKNTLTTSAAGRRVSSSKGSGKPVEPEAPAPEITKAVKKTKRAKEEPFPFDDEPLPPVCSLSSQRSITSASNGTAAVSAGNSSAGLNHSPIRQSSATGSAKCRKREAGLTDLNLVSGVPGGTAKRKATSRGERPKAKRRKSGSGSATTPVRGSSCNLQDDDAASDQSISDLWALFDNPVRPGTEWISEVENEPRFQLSTLPIGVDLGDSVFVLNKGNWWLARLIAFEPADSLEDQRKGKDTWVVEDFFHEIHRRRARDVITMGDERIADCILGDWTMDRMEYTSTALIRPPTPPLLNPDEDVTKEQFVALPMPERLRRIRPHLERIISDQYPPAVARSDKFFDPDYRVRQSLVSSVRYGDIPEDEAAQVILPELARWARRAEAVGEEARAGQPPRPTGSARYNAIPPERMKEYIENVLLPEAIIHLLICSEDLHQSAPNGEASARAPALHISPDQAHTTATDDDQETTYQAAIARLEELRSHDQDKDWARRASELKRAREQMRQKRGLPDELLDKEELQRWKECERLKEKDYEVGRGGRVRTKVVTTRGRKSDY
ncbi:hypothetical protein IAU60_006130 [Kwoniella sp. DSM 27419]